MWKKVIAGTLLSVCIWAGDAAAGDLDVRPIDQQTVDLKELKKVISYDKDVVKCVMIEDHFSEQWADERLILLSGVDAKLQPLLDAYIKDHTISDQVKVEGLSVKMLMDRKRWNFWDALIGLNDCVNDPELAKLTMNAIHPSKGE